MLLKKVAAFYLSLAALAALVGGCGSAHHHKGGDDGDGDDANQAQVGSSDAVPAPGDGWITRGRWTLAVDSSSGTAALTTDDNQPISATIAPGVVFTVSNTSFKPPTPTGVASYGSLTITALSDNNLNVCGTGTDACTAAAITIYTSGAAGAGLWNTAGGYGAPISTGGHVVGLNAAGAASLGSETLAATTHVVNLAQFTKSTSLAIPISVDFTNAGAGSYATTLVVEYGLH